MRYEIKGTPMPVLVCNLDANESIKCEGGSMSWMTANMDMETSSGGIGKMFSKALTGESLFYNTYTARGGQGMISFASSFPGNIIALEIGPGKEIVCQKSSFLAATPGVDVSIFFQKKFGAGLFGGEGFIMQKITGEGLAFLEIDGSSETIELAAGQKLIVDTGCLALMDSSCSIDIQAVKGVKNMFLGGEGMFNTVVSGPGKVTLQTMPAYQLAKSISKYITPQAK